MEIRQKWQKYADSLQKKTVGKTNLLNILIKSSLFILLLAVIPLLFSSDESYKTIDMKIGSISAKKVVAPFNFFVLKTKNELKTEREEAVNKVPFYFNYDPELTGLQNERLADAVPFLTRFTLDFAKLDSTESAHQNFYVFIKDTLKQKFDISFSEANLSILFDIIRIRKNAGFVRDLSSSLKQTVSKGILSLDISEIRRPNVTIIRNGIEENLAAEERIDSTNVQNQIENSLLERFDVNQTIILQYFFAQLITPNLIYDKYFTERAVQQALNNVSRTKDMVYENERIVDANERIDAEIYQKLYSLKTARIERSRREGSWQDRIAYLAKMMLLTAVLLISGLFLSTFRKNIFKDNKTLLMICLILLINLIFASILTHGLNWHAYLIPTTIASMLLAILIDSGIGLLGTVILAFILGGIQGGGYDISLLTFVSGMAGVYSVHQIRTRNQVFKAIIIIGFAYLWLILTLTALRYDSLMEAGKIFLYFLLPNTILSAFITYMLLGVFEKFFDITTDVTLMELSDLNNPLLKRLSLEAPGTFHHSLVVGNLSEAAAKAISANPLLARVGSYYHDIGKMEKPEYFIENQMDAENRHNQLSPNMSTLILTSHIRNGMEMAEKFGLPKSIQNFIPEHHGTNVMSYFYSKAKENAAEVELVEADFRYPGPKPQSKETGILMLADTVEAATRSLQNPTPKKIRAFVEKLVDARFKDGELDECDLTFRDLKTIIDAFMPILYGVFQHRIEYPEQDKDKKKTSGRQSRTNSEKTAHNGNNGTSKQT